jgi:hypothetical protein
VIELASATSAALPQLDLHEAVRDRDGLHALVALVRLTRGPGRQTGEEDPQADGEVIQQRQQARAAALAGIVTAGQLVPALGIPAQQLVERDIELRREIEQRVERKAGLPALGVGDRTRRHAGEACEIGLAEIAPLAQAAQRRREPRGGRRRREPELAVLRAEGENAPLDPGRPAIGLGDPHAVVVHHEHALGDLLDLAAERRQGV